MLWINFSCILMLTTAFPIQGKRIKLVGLWVNK